MRRPHLTAIAIALCVPMILIPSPRAAAQAPSHTKVRVPDIDPALQQVLNQAQEAMNKKDYSTAIKLYSDAVAQKPDDATIHFQLGYAYTAAQDPESAAKEYRRASELNSTMQPAFVNLGLALLDKHPADAVAPLRKAVALSPEDSRPKFLLGVALEKSGDLPSAIDEFRAARDLDSTNIEIQLALARALLQAKRYPEAEKEFRAALVLRPDDPIAHYALAESLVQQKKNEQAAAELASYLQSSPKDAAARTKRAEILISIDRNDEAIAELDRAAAVRAETPQSLRLRAEADLRLKNYDAATAALQKLQAAAPSDPEIHPLLGRVLLEKKDYPAAVKELVPAFRATPSDLQILHDLLAAEYLAGNYTAALALLEEAEKRESLPIDSWYFRASCYDKLGQKRLALDNYRKFLDLNNGKTSDEYFVSSERVRILERELKEKKQ